MTRANPKDKAALKSFFGSRGRHGVQAWTGFVFVYGQRFCGIGAAWRRPLGFAVNIIFAVVLAYLVVVVRRWLFGREDL